MARILIIDDDPLVRLSLCAILETAGHQVDEAKNGLEGIGKYRRTSADLVITNIVMPEMDGLETIRELERIKPGLRLIAISGYDPGRGRGYLTLAEEYGALYTFTKPFDRAEVLEAVEKLLDEP